MKKARITQSNARKTDTLSTNRNLNRIGTGRSKNKELDYQQWLSDRLFDSEKAPKQDVAHTPTIDGPDNTV